MPDPNTAIPAPTSPAVTLQCEPPAWVNAVREHLRGTEPCSEGVRRIRGLLEHLHPGEPRERMLCLSRLISAAPAAFRTLAVESGWSSEMEIYLSSDLAVIASVLYSPEDRG